MNVSKPRILIAGAGIGGIVAALALLQRGFGVALYEQVPELHELGAGIAIMPNGSRLLIGLGLEAALEPIASVPSTRETRLFDTGESWPMPGSMSSAARFGSPFWLLHRGDLHLKLALSNNDRLARSTSVSAASASNRMRKASTCCWRPAKKSVATR